MNKREKISAMRKNRAAVNGKPEGNKRQRANFTSRPISEVVITELRKEGLRMCTHSKFTTQKHKFRWFERVV